MMIFFALDVTEFAQTFPQCRHSPGLSRSRGQTQETDPIYLACLLRTQRKGPCCRRSRQQA